MVKLSRRSVCGAVASSLFLPRHAKAGLHLHGTGAVPYLGLVASRARPLIQGVFGGSSATAMSRSAHVSTDNITALKIVMGNFNCGNPDATISSGGQTITASVEYPSGTFTQIKFGGIAQGSIASLGLTTSDSTAVSIPNGTLFWIRLFVGGGPGWNNFQNSFLGEVISLVNGAQSDLTMGGAITNTNSASMPPLAIIGMTTKPSVTIVGDSIGFGLGDVEDSSASATGFDAKVGIVARSLGSVPFVNIAVTGMLAQTWVGNSSGKKLLLGNSSHLITQLGRNDLSSSRTTAQITSDLQSIWALAKAVNANTKLFQSTITPLTTDPGTPAAAWTTLGQQSLVASSAERDTFNAAVRAVLAQSNGSYDLTQPLETATTNGKWVVTPTPPYTSDGTHPTVAGYALVAAAGLIPTPAYP